MIRLSIGFLGFGAPALAHPGHIETLAGHDHVSAGILIGIAIAIGVYGALKGKDEEPEETPEEEAA